MDKERRIIPDAGLAVLGGRIIAVGSRGDISEIQWPQTINAAGRLIVPDLLWHTHIPMTLFRVSRTISISQDWLTKLHLPRRSEKRV